MKDDKITDLESRNVSSVEKTTTNGNTGGYSLRQADLQEPTLIAATQR